MSPAPLTVACVWVQGNVPFDQRYVWRLKSMVARHLLRPHRFICLTDRPAMVQCDDVETISVATPHDMPGWWAKLELFNPAHGLSGLGLYLDLDVLVVNDLAPIVDFKTEAPLVLIPHEGTFEGRDGKATVKAYNSSVMRIQFGANPGLWRTWNVRVTRRLWGDQDWIAECLPGLPTMPLEWFPRLSALATAGRLGPALGRPDWPAAAKVILCKKPKNHVALHQWSWFDNAWR